MRITYDDEVDVLYVQFCDAQVCTRHVTDEIAFDYDHDGRLAGIEILGASAVIGVIRPEFGVAPLPMRPR
jgi:uncharacterized protein YuzE